MNGLFVIDKPSGITSHDVVARLRRITGEKSIGHLGTLDPMATGVLPLLVGRYTRLAQYFNAAEKSYSGTIRFGFATDTYDAEGELVGQQTTPHLTIDEIRTAAFRFNGELQQMPPRYSAKKIAGTPAYKFAREGKPVELKPATVRIDTFEITTLKGDTAAFTMRISAGGYVRSVAHELGTALGCGAHLTSLRRTHAGPFTLADAHTLDELQPLAGDLKALTQISVHPRTLLPDMPSVTASLETQGRMRNGMQTNLPEFSTASRVKVFATQRELFAIAQRVAGTLFQPITVMG
ncbi:MAG TPA: tRNA pseudouridine(55) synthase TruB [Terracidiphilus sp.]|nr:tRNA pseudouridine(55) synthase TruB [Terracidiphilus sp.]